VVKTAPVIAVVEYFLISNVTARRGTIQVKALTQAGCGFDEWAGGAKLHLLWWILHAAGGADVARAQSGLQSQCELESEPLTTIRDKRRPDHRRRPGRWKRLAMGFQAGARVGYWREPDRAGPRQDEIDRPEALPCASAPMCATWSR